MDMKKMAGEAALQFVRDGMRIGLGTGSTVYWTIIKLGERVQQGLNIQAIATSAKTEKLAANLGIPMLQTSQIDELDLAIDGADEIAPGFQLIKGGGGALLREKMVASIARRFIVAADESKLVDRLGAFPLPVEVVAFGWELTRNAIRKLGCDPILRTGSNGAFKTDNANLILDCRFQEILNPAQLNADLNSIPGVVENGLFIGMADTVIIGHKDGKVEIMQS
jgi:ribose 5-phosphate isomerase A